MIEGFFIIILTIIFIILSSLVKLFVLLISNANLIIATFFFSLCLCWCLLSLLSSPLLQLCHLLSFPFYRLLIPPSPPSFIVTAWPRPFCISADSKKVKVHAGRKPIWDAKSHTAALKWWRECRIDACTLVHVDVLPAPHLGSGNLLQWATALL